MKFLKNFFNDESTIVGLCGFETTKPKYSKSTNARENFLNRFNIQRTFETNFEQNVFLEV
ncbi:MAG: hypothetical protein WCY19_01300 [Candidatus Gastranaerophilaceae bacterium]